MAIRRFLVFAVVAGLIPFASGQQGSTPAPPGKLVDLGGFHVHIFCTGSGGPPVILLHGLGDYSFDWALVQPRVAANIEVCAYDRPAQAWSEPGPAPRGVMTSAHELHLLLQRANVKCPCILVGHSWGGLIARMFAHEYPQETAGMVLVDATHEEEYLWINGKIIRPGLMTDGEWAELTKPKKPANPAPADGSPQQSAPAPRAVQLDAPYDKLPADAQKLQIWAMSLPFRKERFDGGDTTNLRADFVEMHQATARTQHPLGNIPLIVLSKTPTLDNDDDYTPEQLAWNRQLQNELAALSTNSQYVVAEHSGHHIQLDEPELVSAAILRVLDAVNHHHSL